MGGDEAVTRRKHSRTTLARRVIREVRGHPGNRAAPNRAVARAVGWQVRKRLTRGNVQIDAYGLDLLLPRDSGSLSNFFYFGQAFEWETVNFVRAFLRPGDTVVDGGANVGMFTYLTAQCVGPRGRIYAFEPLGRWANVVEQNVVRNGLHASVVVHPVALSDRPGTVWLTDDLDVSNHFTVESSMSRSSREVPTKRLDEVVHESVTLLKLDLEGAEMLALRGATEVLERDEKPVIIVEAHDHALRRLGSSRAEVIHTLQEWGYAPLHYNVETRECEPKGWEIPGTDLICAPRGGVDEVQSRIGSEV